MDIPKQILMNLPSLKTYIPVHLRDITDITDQLNLSDYTRQCLVQIGETVKHDR